MPKPVVDNAYVDSYGSFHVHWHYEHNQKHKTVANPDFSNFKIILAVELAITAGILICLGILV